MKNKKDLSRIKKWMKNKKKRKIYYGKIGISIAATTKNYLK